MTKIFKFYDNVTHNVRSGQFVEKRHNRFNNFGVKSISTSSAKILALVSENLNQTISVK